MRCVKEENEPPPVREGVEVGLIGSGIECEVVGDGEETDAGMLAAVGDGEGEDVCIGAACGPWRGTLLVAVTVVEVVDGMSLIDLPDVADVMVEVVEDTLLIDLFDVVAATVVEVVEDMLLICMPDVVVGVVCCTLDVAASESSCLSSSSSESVGIEMLTFPTLLVLFELRLVVLVLVFLIIRGTILAPHHHSHLIFLFLLHIFLLLCFPTKSRCFPCRCSQKTDP